MKRKIDKLAENLAQKKTKQRPASNDMSPSPYQMMNANTSSDHATDMLKFSMKNMLGMPQQHLQMQQQQQHQFNMLNSQAALLANMFPNNPVNFLSLLAQQQQQANATNNNNNNNNSASNTFASALLSNPSILAMAMAAASNNSAHQKSSPQPAYATAALSSNHKK
jgi:hypothetical protein